jgi:hypothetical protein
MGPYSSPAYRCPRGIKKVQYRCRFGHHDKKWALYSVISKVLDGIEGNSVGVSVVQDGTMRGGGSIYYHVGSYTCSNGKWKGELTVLEHEPALVTELFARKVVTMGFTGTYNDDGAEFEATALVGKRSARLKMILRLLIPDQVDNESR